MGYLERQAKRTEEGFNTTNENYQKALDLSLQLGYVKTDKNVAGLRQLYDTLEVHIRSLLSLIIMERLPHSVKLVISRSLKDKGWNLTELLLTIKNELYAREACENSKVEKKPEIFRGSTSFKSKIKSF